MPKDEKAKAIEQPTDEALKKIVFINGVKWLKVTEKEVKSYQKAGSPAKLSGFRPFPSTIDGIYYPIENGIVGLALLNKEI